MTHRYRACAMYISSWIARRTIHTTMGRDEILDECEACGRIIGPSEIEFESEFKRGAESLTLHLHRQCWENGGSDESAS